MNLDIGHLPQLLLVFNSESKLGRSVVTQLRLGPAARARRDRVHHAEEPGRNRKVHYESFERTSETRANQRVTREKGRRDA